MDEMNRQMQLQQTDVGLWKDKWIQEGAKSDGIKRECLQVGKQTWAWWSGPLPSQHPCSSAAASTQMLAPERGACGLEQHCYMLACHPPCDGRHSLRKA